MKTAPPDRFAATRWTVVLAAAQQTSHESRRALEELCRIYWYPLYVYVRRSGYEEHTAEDLTQEFFAKLLAKKTLAGVDPTKGKFRSFLVASLKHFLANEWDKARAQKRGGDRTIVSLDAETRYRTEPADGLTADKLLDRRWALALLDQVLGRLQAESEPQQFALLKPVLTAGAETILYAEVAGRLGMTEGAVKVAVHRLRKRYRVLLREEIAHTVASSAEVDEELRHLFAAFSS